METVEETVGTKREMIHGNYCREMACIQEKLGTIPLEETERRGRLVFRLNDISGRLIPRLFSVSLPR